MERNTKTTLGALQLGDRFYKAGDKNKRVWEVNEKFINATIAHNPNFLPQYRFQSATRIVNTTPVIFLRHNDAD